jgi:hypothetical protein
VNHGIRPGNLLRHCKEHISTSSYLVDECKCSTKPLEIQRLRKSTSYEEAIGFLYSSHSFVLDGSVMDPFLTLSSPHLHHIRALHIATWISRNFAEPIYPDLKGSKAYNAQHLRNENYWLRSSRALAKMRGLRRLEIDLVNENNQPVFEDQLLKELAHVTVRRIRFLDSLFLSPHSILSHPRYYRDILIALLLPKIPPSR